MKTLNISDETYELIKNQLKDTEKTDIKSLQDLEGKKLEILLVNSVKYIR